MTKLYYTDAFKAAWMAREHGVEFGDGIHEEVIFDLNHVMDHITDLVPPVFLVHPFSYRIFEPREWDAGINEDDLLIQYYEGFWWYQDEKSLTPLREIINRSGEAFFWPEVEE